jgi:hypothetical protein
MNEWLIVLLVVLLLPYWLVPYFIWKNQSFSVSPRLKPMLSGFLPESIAAHFSEVTNELEGIGFEFRQDAVSFDYGPNLRVFLRILVAQQKKIMAVAASILPDGEVKPASNFLELVSSFSDGREVTTHNSDMVGAPIEHKTKTVSSLFMVQDLKKLTFFHEQIMQQQGLKAETAVVPTLGQEFEALVESVKRDLARQVSLGALRLDQINKCFRPTWAGAFLMGWCSLWPISPLRRGYAHMRARWQMRTLGKYLEG